MIDAQGGCLRMEFAQIVNPGQDNDGHVLQFF